MPPWLTATLDVLRALSTPTIAAVGVAIAYQQKRQGDIRLRIERFDRRYAIFASAKKLLAGVLRDGTANNDDTMSFLRDVTAGKW
jgi:hypothetical protein